MVESAGIAIVPGLVGKPITILIQKRCFANTVFYRKIERSQTDCVGDLEEPL